MFTNSQIMVNNKCYCYYLPTSSNLSVLDFESGLINGNTHFVWIYFRVKILIKIFVDITISVIELLRKSLILTFVTKGPYNIYKINKSRNWAGNATHIKRRKKFLTY